MKSITLDGAGLSEPGLLRAGFRDPTPLVMSPLKAKPTPKGGGKGAPKTGGGGGGSQGKEINIIGNFDWDPLLSLKDEVDRLGKGLWEPGSKDFAAVARKSVKASTFGDFVATILRENPGSIRVINVFTHANPGTIAFGGRMVPRSITTDVLMNVNSGPTDLIALDSSSLARLNTPGLTLQVVGQGRKDTLADVRARFTSTAAIFFYACHSGSDGALLQEVADTFQVTAVGFSPPIAYCPRFTTTPPSIDRSQMDIALKSCSRRRAPDFHQIFQTASGLSDIIARKPQSKPQTRP